MLNSFEVVSCDEITDEQGMQNEPNTTPAAFTIATQ